MASCDESGVEDFECGFRLELDDPVSESVEFFGVAILVQFGGNPWSQPTNCGFRA